MAWTLVLVQIALLVGLAAWPAPQVARDWTAGDVAGAVVSAIGLGFAVVALLHLGPGLTASPIPRDAGVLRATGLYAFTRHPVYSGLLLFAVGRVMSHPSLTSAGLALALLLLLWSKASWEERMLRDRFPEYGTYAARVPRFVPRTSWRRRSRRRASSRDSGSRNRS